MGTMQRTYAVSLLGIIATSIPTTPLQAHPCWGKKDIPPGRNFRVDTWSAWKRNDNVPPVKNLPDQILVARLLDTKRVFSIVLA
ncbi:hypothetical protein B0O99DRAFT_636742 [Bisporella sp. PMI_857]|nr:hypothetical protein B0O99DRAFT_636742 [Bisporella sp. PMI_857]